ncbi:MAG: amidohydrolase family protein [Solirubrobacteraceae bacterium]
MGNEEKQRIDFHCHHLPPVFMEAVRAAAGKGTGVERRGELHTIGGIPVPPWSKEAAFKFMDEHGIAVQLLSVPPPAVEFVPEPSDALALARALNDYVSGLAREHPDRFGAFAVVSMCSPEVARDEAVRALDELGHDGVGLLSNYGGRYLGDPWFDPLMVELDARRAWTMVHPTPQLGERLTRFGVPEFAVEYPFDTTRTIVSLLFNGSFQRYPNIRWQFGHGGGVLAMLRRRLVELAAAAEERGAALGLAPGASLLRDESPATVLRRSFFDTALVSDIPALRANESMAGVDQIVFGSDWPYAARLYTAPGDPQPPLNEVFSPEGREAVDRLNAVREFPRLSEHVVGTI